MTISRDPLPVAIRRLSTAYLERATLTLPVLALTLTLMPGDGEAAALALRDGVVRLVRDDATDLVYTVDDAATGAGLVNAILGARRG